MRNSNIWKVIATLSIHSIIFSLSIAAVIKRHAEDSGPMYIVGWRNNMSREEYKVKLSDVESKVFGIREVTEDLKPIEVHISDAYHAMCTYLTPEVKQSLEADTDVLYVEERVEMKAFATQLFDQSLYNLDVLDGQVDNKFWLPDDGCQNSVIYVVDTGVATEHAEFNGRAVVGAVFARNSGRGDVQGHGSHVSSTAAGAAAGVAKNATIVGVKVLGDNGSGSNVGVIQGIQWAVDDCKKRQANCVINMSLGGPASQAVDDAVKAATNAGVVVVVAAGNERRNACQGSPSREPSAITVGATDRNNNIARFSNFGTCVDVLAPGVSIVAASSRDPSSLKTASGTSMASPLVAGL
ncbi:peptidase S8/S53 domain-containing protein [Paraphysoderma sedebokerense]|nr:peptidase S8/S53 domain-containing protein [Paraphysoderma sedebokerense]